MRRAWSGAIAIAGACFAASGCSARASEDALSISQAIQGGETDAEHRYAVGICRGSPGKCNVICSGALILPNVVATARHCVDNSVENVDCSTSNPSFGARLGGTLYITTNATMSDAASGWYLVKSIGTPQDAHVCGNDIALLVLEHNVPASEAKPVTPGIQYLMWDPASGYVPVYTAIGYGNESPSNSGAGTRRKRELRGVACIPGSAELDCPTENQINPKEFIGDDGICSGDSGSNAFEASTYDKGSPVSFGVLSRGGEEGNTCVGSAYTRFDAHRDFVLAVAKTASANWTAYPEPPWTAPKPAPATKGDSKPTAPKATASDLGLGQACTEDSECKSQICADQGDGSKSCSKSCSETSSTSCPQGYECRDDLCLLAPAGTTPAAAPTTIVKKTGCSTGAAAPRTGGGWLAGVALAVGVLATRHRKRDRG
jgi:hypothetical protein